MCFICCHINQKFVNRHYCRNDYYTLVDLTKKKNNQYPSMMEIMKFSLTDTSRNTRILWILKLAILTGILLNVCTSELPFCHPTGSDCRPPNVCKWTQLTTTIHCACKDLAKCQANGYLPGYHKQLHVNCSLIERKLQCFCDSGYNWNVVGLCVDVNECQRSVCPQHADCVNSNGSFACVCSSGFTMSSDGSGKTCNDVDECSIDATQCPSNSHCYNIPGAYTCQCNKGYHKRGRDPICRVCPDGTYGESCARPCPRNCKSRNCDRVTGRCDKCSPGYYGDHCDQDIDECRQSSSSCPNNSICTNIVAGFRCTCRAGFIEFKNNKKTVCQDINECVLPDTICPKHSICRNAPGRYYCECDGGYRWTRTGCVVCTDGSYGLRCSGRCARGCNPAKPICHPVTGYCTQGCRMGFSGRVCDKSPSSDSTTRNMLSQTNNVTTSSPGRTQANTVSSSSFTRIMIGVGVGVGGLTLLIIAIVCVVCKSRKKKSKLSDKTDSSAGKLTTGTDYFRKERVLDRVHNVIADDLPSAPFSDFDSFDDETSAADEMAVFATIGKRNKAGGANPARRSKAYVNVNIVDEVPQLTVHLRSSEYSTPVPIGQRKSQQHIYDTTT